MNASFWFRAADEAARMHAALQVRAASLADGVQLWLEGNEVGAYRPLAPADMPAFEVHLDAQLGQWIDVLRVVGGLAVSAAAGPAGMGGSRQGGGGRTGSGR